MGEFCRNADQKKNLMVHCSCLPVNNVDKFILIQKNEKYFEGFFMGARGNGSESAIKKYFD